MNTAKEKYNQIRRDANRLDKCMDLTEYFNLEEKLKTRINSFLSTEDMGRLSSLQLLGLLSLCSSHKPTMLFKVLMKCKEAYEKALHRKNLRPLQFHEDISSAVNNLIDKNEKQQQ